MSAIARVALSAFATVSGQTTFGPCYLYDNYCLDNPDPSQTPGPIDGNDPRKVPWLHSKGCLLHAPECTTNGYSLNCRDPNASGELLYKRMYKFDDAGSAAALAWIQAEPAGNDLCITVQGITGSIENGATALSSVAQFTRATGCSGETCTSGPNLQACQNGGTAKGTEGSCNCDCPNGFSGDWCESTTSCVPSTLDVGEPLECVHTVMDSVLMMHYKANKAAKTVFLCFENLVNNGYVAAGPGQSMIGTSAVVAASDHDNTVFKITQYSKPTDKLTNFGLSKTLNIEQNGRRINCFQMPYSSLGPDENSVNNADIAWAVGNDANFDARHKERGVYKFNFESGASENIVDVPGLIIVHVILMMLAFLILYPMGVLVAVYAGPHFQKGAAYFKTHAGLMMLAILVNIVGVIFAWSHSKIDTAHGVLGLVVSCLCVMQPINAFFRPSKEHKKRRYWEYLHKGVGRLCAVLGLTTCVFGAVIFDDRYGHLSLMLPLVLVPLVVAVVTWLVLRISQVKDLKKKHSVAE